MTMGLGSMSNRDRGAWNQASGVNSVTSTRDPTSETSQRSEAASLYRLMSWLTPAYPVGAYAYSGGIEWAVEAGDICDGNTLRRWLATLLQHGNLFSDAVIFVNAHRAVARGDAKAVASCAAPCRGVQSNLGRHAADSARSDRWPTGACGA